MADPADVQRGREHRADGRRRADGARAAAAPEGFRILVVDDSSPDGTGAIADRLAAAQPGRGRGPAPRASATASGRRTSRGSPRRWTAARATSCEMDADFSHDPADLARLLAAARGGADLALGSRYVAGGGVADWGALRRVVSRGGSCVRAPRARRRRPRPHRRLQVLPPRGPRGDRPADRALARLRLPGRADLSRRLRRLRVVEVPIVFRDRRRGESKMSWRIAVEAAWLVPAIRRSARNAVGPAAARLKLRPPRAEAMRDGPSRPRPRPGARPHARDAAPVERGARPRRRAVGARRVRDRLRAALPRLGGRRIASRRTPRRCCCPASTSRRPSSPSAQVLGRNSLVLALHAFACVAGYIAGSSAAGRGRRAIAALSRRDPRAAGPLAIAFVARRDAVLARDAGLRPRQRRRDPVGPAADRPGDAHRHAAAARAARAHGAVPAARRMARREPARAVGRAARGDGRDDGARRAGARARRLRSRSRVWPHLLRAASPLG